MSDEALENLLAEDRTFPPPAEFAAAANLSDPSVYERARRDPEGFWAAEADTLHWFKAWDRVLDWELPFAQWFVGAETNMSYNCLDRHVNSGGGDKVAYHWEGEPGDTRTITYAQLLEDGAGAPTRCASSASAPAIVSRSTCR